MAGSDGRSEKEKMLAGVLYRAVGLELAADNLRADRLLRAYNATGAEEVERRIAILAELLGVTGEGVVVRPPFHCDYGYNIRFGHGTFVNFGCVFLDVAAIDSVTIAKSVLRSRSTRPTIARSGAAASGL
jgi:maltose O-acetyltransferase